MTTTRNDPAEFGTMNCRDGITIRRPGREYEVHVNGRFETAAETLYEAMNEVERIRQELVSR